ERMARLRAAPAGADQVRIFGEIPLRQVVGGGDRHDVDGLLGGADRRQRVAARSQEPADEEMHLVLQGEILRPGDGGIGLCLFVLAGEISTWTADDAISVMVEELE